MSKFEIMDDNKTANGFSYFLNISSNPTLLIIHMNIHSIFNTHSQTPSIVLAIAAQPGLNFSKCEIRQQWWQWEILQSPWSERPLGQNIDNFLPIRGDWVSVGWHIFCHIAETSIMRV